MIIDLQTLMNVLKEQINVIKVVTTPLAVILATVLNLAIDFTVMVQPVKVSIMKDMDIPLQVLLHNCYMVHSMEQTLS